MAERRPGEAASRIASLCPAATAWIAAIGAADLLVAGSDQCPVRAGRPDLPVAIRSGRGPSRALRPAAPRPRSLPADADEAVLRAARPDLVIVDAFDDAWESGTAARLREVVGADVEFWAWEARTMRDTLEFALRLGRRVGRLGEAMEFLGRREMELQALRDRIGIHRRAPDAELPRVLVVSALDPPVLAGGWLADLVDRAALRLVAPPPGIPAFRVGSTDIVRMAPDLVIVALPGVPLSGAVAAAGPARGEWPAHAGVVCYDPTDRIDLPGPGLHEAILDLAAVAHGLTGRNLEGRCLALA